MILGEIARPLKIPLLLEKGEVNRYPKVKLYNFSGVFVAEFELTHIVDGLYLSDEWVPDAEGYFYCVAEVFFDAGYTIRDTSYGQVGDTIKIDVSDRIVRLGVVYDIIADICYIEMSLEHKGQRVADGISNAEAIFYSADDTPLFTVSDTTPDGLGVFRMSKETPGFTAGSLYSVKCSITRPDEVVVTTKEIAVVS